MKFGNEQNGNEDDVQDNSINILLGLGINDTSGYLFL